MENEVRSRSEKNVEKDYVKPRRRMRSHSPPPLVSTLKRPWKTIFLVNQKNSLYQFLVAFSFFCWLNLS